ncbi:MAG: hypothetical protein MT490_06665 [Sphingomonas sp.]|uniref:hypothetical protein n=1 Tax=Sphingomonas sp. TaxID=28214 RepID=UPI002274C0AF|nr:hypothetical protein [Sphingomonas sp.]MCX8475464.1 hypothetical protein [Sphingomonas sp.]
MIQPFAAPSGVLPRLDPPAGPNEAASEASFADMLGDPGPAVEVPVAAQMIAASPNAALAMPSDGSDPEATPLDAKAVAERFNEHGFFGKAVSALARAAARVATASEPAAVAAQAAQEAGLAPVDTRAAASRHGAFAKVEAGGSRSLPPAHLSGTSGTAPQAATGQPVSAPAEGAEETEGVRATASGRRLLGAAAERAAQSATRVAVSETGRGLHVAAFAQALPEDERSRLRDEIAALLSRHGLRPDRIHIAARRVPPASA